MRRSTRSKYIFSGIAILVLVCGCGYWWSRPAKSVEVKNEVPDRLYTVKSGDLVIGIRQVGFVNSQKSHKMALEAAVATKLLWVIPENTRVKKGDVLAKFETDDQVEKIDNSRLEVDNLAKELEIELESRKMLLSSNEASIRSAEDKVVSSEDAYKKYRNFERTQKRDSLELDLQKAQKSYDDAVSEYVSQKATIEAKGTTNDEATKKNEKTLSELKQKVDNAKNEWNKAELELKVFKRYANPNKLTELVNQMEQDKLELNKTKISTASQILQKDSGINNIQVRLRKKKEQLEKEEACLPLMKIVSPVDGVVIYGDPDVRWGKTEIRLGMDIRRGQVLMTIPDMSRLVVEFDLPEQYRSKANIGDRVVITPEGLKQLRFEGTLARIDQLPVNQIFWDQNSPKIYKSEVKLDNQDPRLVCGMSVQLEIITKVLKNAVFVPIEAVFEEGGKYFVYKKAGFNPKKQLVKIGQSNDNNVQILEGVADGDVVYLYKPFQRKEGGS